jgi:hypothetical protein
MTPENTDTPLKADCPSASCSPSLLTDAELETLNPGIRHTVQTLRKWGFNTCDSGDGSTHEFECDLPHPYVHILVDPLRMVTETDRLLILLINAGIDFNNHPHPQEDPEGYAKHPTVEASYLPTQGRCAAIHLMNIILPENGKNA